jgi:hypothetical protein
MFLTKKLLSSKSICFTLGAVARMKCGRVSFQIQALSAYNLVLMLHGEVPYCQGRASIKG